MDDNYHIYLNRVVKNTLPATYDSQLQHIQESPKFKHPESGGEKQPVPFPGYTIITPPWEEDQKNTDFYGSLHQSQQDLIQQVEPGLILPVPANSFHFTLADLIWDSSYRHVIEKNPDFDGQLQAKIGEIFQKTQPELQSESSICWQLLGIMLMARAIAICLAPKNEESYERIVRFRREIYQNSGLMALGIEQQYHLTAHVTIGYFGTIPTALDRDRLTKTVSHINDRWLDSPQEIIVERAELRKFDDMTRYYREPGWPVLTF